MDGASSTPAGRVSTGEVSVAADWSATWWPAPVSADGDVGGTVAGGRWCRRRQPPTVGWGVEVGLARMSPVFTSITMATPQVAWEATISAPRACSATYWTDSSMVSSMPVPALAGALVAMAPDRATPSGDSEPLLGAGRAGQQRLVLVLEPGQAGAVRADRAQHRLGQLAVGLRPAGARLTRLMPVRLSAVTLAATASVTRWAR